MGCFAQFGTICTILKNMRNTRGGVLFLVKLQTEACNFTKSNIPPWVFFTFLKIVQTVPNCAKHLIL